MIKATKTQAPIYVDMAADPEFLLEVNGENVACCGKLPGTKKTPFPLKASKIGTCIQEDGVAVEINFSPVSPSLFDTVARVSLIEALAEVRKYYGTTAMLKPVPFAEFPQEELQTFQANTFGCDKDFNAYERGLPRPPVSAQELGNIRCFGGHIHIGYDTERVKIPKWALVMLIEAMWYAPVICQYGDVQSHRRKFYGMPGLFRPKPYGIEYRTPAPFWLGASRGTGDLGDIVSRLLNNQGLAQTIFKKIPWSLIKTLIENDGDTRDRNKIFNKMDSLVGMLYNETDNVIEEGEAEEQVVLPSGSFNLRTD